MREYLTFNVLWDAGLGLFYAALATAHLCFGHWFLGLLFLIPAVLWSVVVYRQVNIIRFSRRCPICKKHERTTPNLRMFDCDGCGQSVHVTCVLPEYHYVLDGAGGVATMNAVYTDTVNYPYGGWICLDCYERD